MAKTNDSDHVRQKVAAGLNLRQKFFSGSLFVALLILVLVGMPSTGLSKTLTRSCKGAVMIQYEISGKEYTHIGPYNFQATGTSKGTVPSPVKARRRACEAAAELAAKSVNNLDQVLIMICEKHPNGGVGRILFRGGIGRDKDEKKTHNLGASKAFRCSGGKVCPEIRSCGDGFKEGNEECDDGEYNSDTQPNKCRTNCRLPHCGDRVVDNGEECDDGNENSNGMPDACRSNCTKPYCGDGVVDQKYGEVCDDGNSDPKDGCHQCQVSHP